MLIDLIILLLSALAGGLAVFFVPKLKDSDFKLTLVFSGAYLFAITIIHILPELFAVAPKPAYVGMLIVLGFFMQSVLEYFTIGVEHGHIHAHEADAHSFTTPVFLLLALCIHSFLEGGLLAHPHEIHVHHDVRALLVGIVMHKMPAAFALMSVLMHQLKKRSTAIIFLLVFALASPIGLMLNTYLSAYELISTDLYVILFSLVCGNFLHISTTIFFESSPEHSFNGKKLAVAAIGAFLAAMVEFVIS